MGTGSFPPPGFLARTVRHRMIRSLHQPGSIPLDGLATLLTLVIVHIQEHLELVEQLIQFLPQLGVLRVVRLFISFSPTITLPCSLYFPSGQ